MFRTMGGLSEGRKAAMIDLLRSVGVTPQGLFDSLHLGKIYETPAAAYFWS